MSPQPHIAPTDTLIAEYKLLRILSPELKQEIESHYLNSPYVLQENKQLYLSLEHITDARQREFYYQTVQCYQVGQEADLMVLPSELQRILRPDMAPSDSFFGGPLLVGAVVGLVIGVLAMAVGILFVNATAVTFSSTLEVFNLQAPIIIFVVFTAIGWALTSFIVWRRWEARSQSHESPN